MVMRCSPSYLLSFLQGDSISIILYAKEDLFLLKIYPVEFTCNFFPPARANVSNKEHKLMKRHNSSCQLCRYDSVQSHEKNLSICGEGTASNTYSAPTTSTLSQPTHQENRYFVIFRFHHSRGVFSTKQGLPQTPIPSLADLFSFQTNPFSAR